MAIAIDIAAPDLQPVSCAGQLSLSLFLAHLVEDGHCFCCDSPTDLMVDERGRMFIRCLRCRAEISAEDATREGGSHVSVPLVS